jgi:4-hydroxy-tetrahydrodipicolinate synthase
MTDNQSDRMKGVLAPVLTPFDAEGKPDPVRLERICRWLISHDCGLAIFGTNSEGNSLSVPERMDLLDHLVAAGLPVHRMMPGTGSCSLPEAVSLTRAVVDHGCGGALVLPPFYYKIATEDGLFAFFSELIEGVGDERLRIYLYHIPPVTQVGFSHSLVERLLKRYPGVIAGMKDSGGDWAYTEKTLSLFASSGFDVFCGTETILLDTMRRGGRGCISATCNVNPGAIVKLYDTWQADDAPQQQEALNVIRSSFAAFPMIAAMKDAVSVALGDPGWTRLRPPLQELNNEERTSLRCRLGELSFDLTGISPD